MATRVIINCDHCGNKIPKANRFMFGPDHRYDEDDEDELPRRKRVPTQKPQVVTKVSVDLCNTCIPIWMDRVKKLTSVSDPE